MKKIEKNKPLPCHTKLDYDECYAKIILETFFPELFHNLEIKDKPDLIDTQHKIGIEVTNATSKKEREILSLSSRIKYGRQFLQQKERYPAYRKIGRTLHRLWRVPSGKQLFDRRNLSFSYFNLFNKSQKIKPLWISRFIRLSFIYLLRNILYQRLY